MPRKVLPIRPIRTARRMRTAQFRHPARLLLCALVLFFVASPARSQITNVTNDQSTPIPGVGHDYIHMLTETVNPANGSVSLRIQAPVPKGRGLTLPFAFSYDSNGVHHAVSSAPGFVIWASDTGYLSEGGWAYSVPMVTEGEETRTAPNRPGEPWTCQFFTDFLFQAPNGSRHALGLAYVPSAEAEPGCPYVSPPPVSYLSGGDDDFAAIIPAPMYIPPVTITDRDGTVYTFPFSNPHYANTSPSVSSLPSQVEDRNGNKAVITDSGNGAFTITDTAGRPAIVSNGFGASGNTVAVSGLAEPYHVNWETVGFNYGVGSTFIGPDAPNCPATMRPVSGNETVISSIELPNGKSYQFFYDGTYGLISKIVFPTGGYVRYVWGINAQSEVGVFTDKNGEPYGCEYRYGEPAVTDRYISYDGVSEVQHQTFAYSTVWGSTYWTAKATTVTTYDLARGGSSQTQYSYGPVTIPNPPDDDSIFASQAPVENTEAYYDGNGKLLRTVTKSWAGTELMTDEKVTLDNGETSETSFTYGSTGQLTDKYEYDYGGALLRHTHINYASFPATPIYPSAPSILDRPSTVITYDGGGNRVGETDYTYDQTGVSSAGVTVGRDPSYNGNTSVPRGNATSKTEWLNTGGASPMTPYTYDDTGQMLSITDPNHNATHYSYGDHYASGSPPGQTNAYLTQITYPNTGVAHVEKFSYNYADGQLASSTDQNGNTTSYAYSDPLDRLTQISYPDGGKTQYSYNDSPPSPSVTTAKAITSSENDASLSIMDGVGHVVRTELTSDPAGTDYTDTTYDGEGRAWTQSNPYRSTSDPSYGVTTTVYDALGRVTSVTRPDGNVASTSYSGNCSTATDEQGKSRESCSDGLGRLAQVVEDPSGLNYHITYSYDALDNMLTSVDGGQTRSFTYDSLSRQLSATNPESGAKTYTYDANGNVATRTDARGVSTTYGYDALNRVLSKSYSDGTPTTLYGYDQTAITMGSTHFNISNSLGRLSWSAPVNPSYYTITMDAYSYDAMGRVKDYWQRPPSQSAPWQTHYNYDLGGDVSSWTHPAGFTITNSINAAQQITQMSYSPSDATHPANLIPSITYTPWGAEQTLEDGCAGSGCTNTVETYAYNHRLQPVMIEFGTTTNAAADYCLVYNYYASVGSPGSCAMPAQGTGGNGNVMGYLYQDSVNPSLSHTATYTYDSLNRLTSAAATGNHTYSLSFTYDPYGNMTCTTQGLCGQYNFSPTTNRITNTGFNYDAAGDQLTDPSYAYQYDAEGRITTILQNGATFETLTYNAHGQAVENDYPGYNSIGPAAFDPWGRELGYYNGGAGVWWDRDIWAAGRMVAGRMVAQSYASETYFLHGNPLHSDTQVGDHGGAVRMDMLYYPWGQIWQTAGTTVDAHFAGFEQSPGPDYPTPSRTYTSVEGRWLTPDPGHAGADPSNPQTWNAYSYAGNNPTTNTDPTGLYCVQDSSGNWHDVGTSGESCADVAKSNAAEQKNPSVTVTGKPGNVAEVVAANFGIGITNLMSSNANIFYSTLTVGQHSPNLPHIPAGSGVAANIGAILPLVGAALVGPEADAGDAAEGIEAAAEENGVATGGSSDYIDVTRPSARVPNRLTNVTAKEFGDNLKAEGYKESIEGDIVRYTKGNTQYTVYRAASTGGPSAQVRIGGKVVATIRLQQ